MDQIIQPQRDQLPELIALWEAAVRATHHFLAEEDLQLYKGLLTTGLFDLELYTTHNAQGITAFLALGDGMVQALFVHPAQSGKGLGTQLMRFAINEKQMRKVEVNEQNEPALAFYKKLGFAVAGRTPVDGMNRPYPILQLELPAATATL